METFETSPLVRSEGFDSDEEARENLKQMLKSLGYISGTNEEDGGETRSVEQVVNLATVLMRQGRVDETITKLEEALEENPGHQEIRLNLAQALARSGDIDPQRKYLPRTGGRGPRPSGVPSGPGHLPDQSGNYSGALEAIDAGLAPIRIGPTGLTARGLYLFNLGRTTEAQNRPWRNPCDWIPARVTPITISGRSNRRQAR